MTTGAIRARARLRPRRQVSHRLGEARLGGKGDNAKRPERLTLLRPSLFT